MVQKIKDQDLTSHGLILISFQQIHKFLNILTQYSINNTRQKHFSNQKHHNNHILSSTLKLLQSLRSLHFGSTFKLTICNFFYNLFHYISLEILLPIIMQHANKRHPSIHTIHLTNKKNSIRSHLHGKNSIRPSTILINQLADARNQVYLQHLEQYYEQLEKIMQENKHKRIKSDMLQLIVFLVTQLSLSILKYFFLQSYDLTNVTILIQIFSIISFFSGLYFITLHILNFGLQSFLKVSFCLDKLNLLLICICFANGLFIKILQFQSVSHFSMQFFVPFWFFYSGSTLRIHVMNYKWGKFQIILSKIGHLVSFVLEILLAWKFIYYQKYTKITSNINSYHIFLIYTIVVSLYFIEFYRLISNFDGTNNLRWQYVFQNNTECTVRRKKKELQEKLQLWKFNK